MLLRYDIAFDNSGTTIAAHGGGERGVRLEKFAHKNAIKHEHEHKKRISPKLQETPSSGFPTTVYLWVQLKTLVPGIAYFLRPTTLISHVIRYYPTDRKFYQK
jgi:hypothetical protein